MTNYIEQQNMATKNGQQSGNGSGKKAARSARRPQTPPLRFCGFNSNIFMNNF